MIIFHGDNQLASRQAFLHIKEQKRLSGNHNLDLSGTSLTLTDLATASQAVSLLGNVNSVFIEEFFARRLSNEKKLLTDYLLKHSDLNIYLWESKDQSTQLKSFPLTISQKFSLPKYLFQFLDTFSHSDLRRSLASASPEQILALLAGHLHKLILVKDGVADLPSWQLAKLKSQAAKYSINQLLTMTSELLSLDYRLKTSFLPYDLSAALELWVLSQ